MASSAREQRRSAMMHRLFWDIDISGSGTHMGTNTHTGSTIWCISTIATARMSHKSMADKPPQSQQSRSSATCSLSGTKPRTTVTFIVSIAHSVNRLVILIFDVSRGLDSRHTWTRT
ncbi:hypothetical protein KCU81_g450, partial [Aureobasidium melanogenum]